MLAFAGQLVSDLIIYEVSMASAIGQLTTDHGHAYYLQDKRSVKQQPTMCQSSESSSRKHLTEAFKSMLHLETQDLTCMYVYIDGLLQCSHWGLMWLANQ